MSISRRVSSAVAALAISAAGLTVATPSPADAATGLKCRAHMSDSTPKQYTNTYVIVKTGKPKAKVRTVAHYKTTKTKKSGKSNKNGKASLKYYVSGATPGYKVKVSVTVKKNGRSKSCSTSFKPHD